MSKAAKWKGERARSMFQRRSHKERVPGDGIWNPEKTLTQILKNTPEWRGK